MEDTDLSEFMHEGGDASDGEDAPDDDVVRAEAEVVAGDADPVVNEIVNAESDALPDVDSEVELMVTQVDYTVEGDGDRERPVLHVFGRTAENTAEHVRVHGFRPYFYAPTETLDDDDLAQDVITGYEETDDDGQPYESIRGEQLTKIFGRTPRDVGNVRDRFEHYEADILFPNRLLIDKDITSGLRVPERRAEDGAVWVHHGEIETCEVDADVRVNTFDIEVDDRSGFPEEGEEPVVCLTSHDSYEDEYIAWLYEAPEATAPAPADVADHDLLDEDADVEVRGFETEEAMHEAFLEYVEATDPDVLTGWNFDDFDAPYYIDRLDELDPYTDRDLDSDRLSRVNEVWTSGWGGPNVKGRVVFDLLYGYQRMQRSELDSYRLDAVGEKELDVGKERYTGDIGDLWEQDPERLLEYNVRDVELCVEIDRKQNIVPFWKEVAEFVGCKLEDATTPGDAVDLYILHKAYGRFVLPSKGQQESEDYEGGAVFDPITGVRENVTVLDLKSLYPMCMVTTNASPETKVDPESYDGETYRAPNGTHFRKEPDGIIREIIDETLAEREQKKALRNDHDPESEAYDRYDRQQAAVKVIMNSLYGVLGWERFRLYDKEMGAAVTATGREVISFTEEAANEIGHEVAYGDTDSVMLELGGQISTEEAIEASFDIEDHINAAYDDFASEELHADEHRFEIEFEKLYRRFFQAGKKKRVIELIVKEGDVDAVEEYVHDVIEDYQQGSVDLDDIGIPGGIGKRLDNYDTDTAQVRGAKYANLLLGTNFQRGSKPKRLYLQKVHPDFFRELEGENPDIRDDPLYVEFKTDHDVICYEYADQIPDEFEVDYDVMLDKTLKGPIERILEALDVSWDEVKSGQTQTGLGNFM